MHIYGVLYRAESVFIVFIKHIAYYNKARFSSVYALQAQNLLSQEQMQ